MLPKLRSITLTSGDVIHVASGVTAIVGPNNSGKSLVLHELVQDISRGHGQRPPSFKGVAECVLEWPEPGRLKDWMRSRYNLRLPGQYSEGRFYEPHYRSPSGPIVAESSIENLEQVRPIAAELVGFYVKLLDAASRLGMASNAGAYNRRSELPSQPAQFLFDDAQLEAEVSAIAERAFGVPLTVNRHGGNEITLHMGKMTAPNPPPPPPREYLDEIYSLPQLQEQGDGMKAFLGIVLTVITGKYPLVVIDEPEAFLHPPQAYLLGKFLAEQHNRDTQIVLATHSEDIIRGIVSAKASGDVSVARLTRSSQSSNHAAQVPADTIRELYEDPLIKYYRILDGLFFQGVVLCEADSDCTYYQAVLEGIPELADGTPTSSVSLYFAHCGGKARMAKAVKALQSAEVPTVSVVDIDFLQNDEEFNALVTICGGDLTKLRPLRNVVLDAVRNKATKVERSVAKVKIDEVLAKKNAAELSSAERAKISEIISASSGWREAKKYGRNLLSGDQIAAFDTLNLELRKLGIFLVEVGELERFHPEIPADNKAAWLRAVLEQQKYLTSDSARTYVSDIATNIVGRQ